MVKYYAASHLRVERSVVDDPIVHGICTAVSTFVARVEERGRPVVWSDARNAAAALRWRLLTEPLAGAEGISVALGVLRTEVHRLAERVDQGVLEELRRLVTAAGRLEDAEDQLGDSIAAATVNTHGSVCVVSVGVSARQAFQRQLSARLPSVAFVSPRQFLNGPVWRRAIVAGISSWFADELFTAPRCVELVLVHHAWLRDRSVVSGLFATAGGSGIELPLPAQRTSSRVYETIRPPAETVDWSGVEPVGGKPQDDDPSDDVPAHLVALAGGYGFYLDVDADTIRGVDPAAAAGHWVRQLPASELDVGSIVLLRKGISERDTLLPRVSAVLGDDEAVVREQQDLWKCALRHHLEAGKLPAIRRALDRPRLTLTYARYWAGRNCISPRQPTFGRLLEYLETKDVEACLSAARKLHSAHLKAGQQLVKELGDSVDEAVIRRMDTEDTVTLSVGSGSGSLQITLFKVIAVSPETTTVPASALRTALQLRGAEWLA
ncbi:hypothetical protein [Amycolatopsis rubida]|uniref:hypothetical protein n=1 Tax=Amycolatopsis rubida TaxID=112413 RepID=UPI001160B6BA|nr:hypothetical protein [Amycolatopsis rubida]